jgi:general stress protein 26
MKQVKTGFFATTDGKRAAVSPMTAYIWFDKEIWLAANAKAGKVQDVRKCPKAEFCFMDAKYNHVRIAGTCKVSEKLADKAAMFKAYEVMKRYFESPESTEWVVLRLKPQRIVFMGRDMQYKKVAL